MRRFLMVFGVLAAATGTMFCYADTIRLKTGAVVEGTIVERANEYLIVRTADTETLYTANEISTVNGKKPVIVKPAAKTQPKGQDRPAPVPAFQQAAVPAGVSSQKQASVLAGALKDVAGDKRLPRVPERFLLYLAGAVVIYAIAIMFLLMKIAEKAGVSSPWHAWVPVANLFLLVRTAGLGYAWVAAFLTGLIPVVGIYLNILAVGYIWWNVARQRKYPGWVGLLVLLVPLGIIPMGLLALKDLRRPVREKETLIAPPAEVPGPTGMETGVR